MYLDEGRRVGKVTASAKALCNTSKLHVIRLKFDKKLLFPSLSLCSRVIVLLRFPWAHYTSAICRKKERKKRSSLRCLCTCPSDHQRYSAPQSPIREIIFLPFERSRMSSISARSASERRNLNTFMLSSGCSETPRRVPFRGGTTVQSVS